jgi:hypothetical protein
VFAENAKLKMPRMQSRSLEFIQCAGALSTEDQDGKRGSIPLFNQ